MTKWDSWETNKIRYITTPLAKGIQFTPWKMAQQTFGHILFAYFQHCLSCVFWVTSKIIQSFHVQSEFLDGYKPTNILGTPQSSHSNKHSSLCFHFSLSPAWHIITFSINMFSLWSYQLDLSLVKYHQQLKVDNHITATSIFPSNRKTKYALCFTFVWQH